MTNLMVLCLLFALISSCAEGIELSQFQFCKKVDTSKLKEELLSVTLDSDIYAVTRASFPDIRIIDNKKMEVLFSLQKMIESHVYTIHQTSESQVVSLNEKGNNCIEIKVCLDENVPAAEGVSFFTPLINYERRVRIFGSDDGKNWRLLVPEGLIFDYSRYMDVSNNEIRLPKNSYRQFKIVIDNVTDEQESPFKLLSNYKDNEKIETSAVKTRPFRIDRIDFWHCVSKQYHKEDMKINYAVVGFKAKEDLKKECTIINVNTRQEPLTGFTLKTTSRNFSRDIEVQVPMVEGIRTKWVKITDATISKVNFQKFHDEQLKITFPQQRQTDYRIIIYNKNNPSLKITGIQAEGNIYRMVFLASGEKTYCIYYGSIGAKQSCYDTAVLTEILDKGCRAVDGYPGRQIVNQNYSQKADLAKSNFLNSKLFFGIVIGLIIIVLTWVLYRTIRQIEEGSKEED